MLNPLGDESIQPYARRRAERLSRATRGRDGSRPPTSAIRTPGPGQPVDQHAIARPAAYAVAARAFASVADVPTVVLTGATRGIGRAAAIELARRGAELALVGRDSGRVRATADEARSVGGGAPVHEHVADLARLDEVRRLASELLERHPRIDVLANNAGAMFSSRHVTPDGFEQTFALNHLAPFLLTNLLLDRLVAARARVVTTASDAHKGGLVDLDDLNAERGRFRSGRVYGTSKLCNVLFTRELQRRRPELTANCFHPGVIRTGFGKNDGALVRVGITIAGLFMGSPDSGARPLVWLARDPAAGELRGQYVEKEQPVAPSAAARDDVLAAALWERSEALTGVATVA
jgi:NAD(P)-dependent dehydrogenase (short-subunit alcohol dehydrogenase family)